MDSLNPKYNGITTVWVDVDVDEDEKKLLSDVCELFKKPSAKGPPAMKFLKNQE